MAWNRVLSWANNFVVDLNVWCKVFLSVVNIIAHGRLHRHDSSLWFLWNLLTKVSITLSCFLLVWLGHCLLSLLVYFENHIMCSKSRDNSMFVCVCVYKSFVTSSFILFIWKILYNVSKFNLADFSLFSCGMSCTFTRFLLTLWFAVMIFCFVNTYFSLFVFCDQLFLPPWILCFVLIIG